MSKIIGSDGKIYESKDTSSYANMMLKQLQKEPQIGLKSPTVSVPEVKPITSLMNGFDYSKGLAIGGDGKVYNNGLNNTFTDLMAQKGVNAGPTVENANLLNNGVDTPWGYKQWGTAASAGLGLGQLGLGIASYLTNKKIAGKQMKLLDQQYTNNADLIKTRKAHNAAMDKGLSYGASMLN